jgi:hypothetical protein
VADRPVATLSFVYGDNVAEWDQRQGVREVARWDPLDPQERTEFGALEDRLKVELRLAGRDDVVAQLEKHDSSVAATDVPGVDQAALGRWEELRRRGQLIGVYLSDPPPWPPS